MKIWIDFSNSPHPLLFEPIARRLEARGHTILVTARDNAQTLELARERFPGVEAFGGESPGGRRTKGLAILTRTRNLRRWAEAEGPDVAVCHNSYAQILAARSLRMPTVTAMDYEHQPANHLAFRLADRILLPAAFPEATARKQGARPEKVIRYDGLKEEIYAGDFEPDPDVLPRIGIDDGTGSMVVVLRAPPAGALYHRSENRLYLDVLQALASRDGVRCVVLARHAHQREALASLDHPGLIVPPSAVDARSLLYASDLVIGAGGTMTREAVVLGIPTATIYQGRPAAVEGELERRGLLRTISRVDELGPVRRKTAAPRPLDSIRAAGARLAEVFIEAVLAAPERS
jgi:uncharacterized protein